MRKKTAIMQTLRTILLAVMISVAVSGQASAAIEAFVARMNIVFQDGSIMFYTGSRAGLVTGEEYVVISNGARIATVRLSRVDEYSSNAIIVSADAPLQEGGVYTFQYSSGIYVPENVIEPKKVKRLGEDAMPAMDKPAKASKKPAEDSAKSSRRRRSADTEETTAEAPAKEVPPKKKPAEEKPKKETKKPAAEKPKPAANDRNLANGISRENLSGMILLPTAALVGENNARFSLGHYKIGSTEPLYGFGSMKLDRKVTSYSLTYGITEKAEFAVSSKNIESEYAIDFRSYGTEVFECDGVVNYCLYPENSKSTKISLKYAIQASSEKDKTPVDVAAIASWEKERYRDRAYGGSYYAESNDSARYFTYGLIGSIAANEQVTLHLMYAWEKVSYHSPSTTYNNRLTNKLRGAGISYKVDAQTDVYIEYSKKEEPEDDSYDYETLEKSGGVRYRLRPDLLLSAAYVHFRESAGSDYLRFNDKYYTLGLDYKL